MADDSLQALERADMTMAGINQGDGVVYQNINIHELIVKMRNVDLKNLIGNLAQPFLRAHFFSWRLSSYPILFLNDERLLEFDNFFLACWRGKINKKQIASPIKNRF